MITIPTWLFVMLCILAAPVAIIITLLILGTIFIAMMFLLDILIPGHAAEFAEELEDYDRE